MDTLIQFSLSLNFWNSQTNNYPRVLSAQTTVYFICLKKTSFNFTCLVGPELIPLIYIGINTILPGNILSTETYTQISEHWAISNKLCVLHYPWGGEWTMFALCSSARLIQLNIFKGTLHSKLALGFFIWPKSKYFVTCLSQIACL